jgi:hypothetical protein
LSTVTGVALCHKSLKTHDPGINRRDNDERYQLDATILFIIINNSTCFGHLYAHLQEYRLYTTAYGVQHWVLWLRF